MKKVKLKFSKIQTAGIKAVLEEAGKGEHDMGGFLMNVILLELAQKVLPKVIFATECSLSLTSSEAFVLAELLYDEHDKGSMCSMMSRMIIKELEPVHRLLVDYNLTVNQ